MLRVFLPLLLALTVLAPTYAQERSALVKSANADLNGDKKPDAISIVIRGADPAKGRKGISFTLTVNGAKANGQFNEYMEGCNGFRVAQIDGKSRLKQIAVVAWASNDFAQTLLYEYNGRTLIPIGDVDADAEISGNGAVYTRNHMAFWWRTEKFAQNPKTRRLVVVPQPAYFVGVPAKVQEPFNIRYNHDTSSGVVAVVGADTEIQVVLYWRGPGPRKGLAGQENDWYLIKTAKGLMGWARFGYFQPKVTELPFAG
jgi:hypothetical protein